MFHFLANNSRSASKSACRVSVNRREEKKGEVDEEREREKDYS